MERAPYTGPLKLGSTGEPVKLMKRALREAGLLAYKGKPSGFFGPFAVRALVKLGAADRLPPKNPGGAWRRGLRKFKTGGIYGPNAHRKLAPHYDAYGASRLRAIARARQVASVQAAGIAAMNLVINNRGSIHYTQSPRRMSGVRGQLVPPRYGSWEDCSSETTWICYVMHRAAQRFGGSFPDPNNLGYNGQGYTGTQINHGVPVNPFAGPVARTMVFYGYPIGHVGQKVSMNRIMSMGSEAGPLNVLVGYRTPTAARAYPLVLPR